MGTRVRNLFNFPSSNLPNCDFFTIFVVGAALDLAYEGDLLDLDYKDNLQTVSQ